jgi:hypothetical protein
MKFIGIMRRVEGNVTHINEWTFLCASWGGALWKALCKAERKRSKLISIQLHPDYIARKYS